MIINSVYPQGLSALIAQLESAAREAVSSGQVAQWIGEAEDIQEHLNLVARPVRRPDKTGSMSDIAPDYAFGPKPARRAQSSLPHAARLLQALGSDRIGTALEETRAIDRLMKDAASLG